MPRRYEIAGQARFLTFSCQHRLPLFINDDIKDRFVEHLIRAKENSHLKLFAWVIMPEHVHLLVLHERPEVTASRFLMQLKRTFAREILSRWRELDAPILNRLPDAQGRTRFWLKGGGYDRNIRSMNEFHEKVAYIEENPVHRGLVKDKDQWRWSSWWWRQRDGYGGALVDSHRASDAASASG